MGETVPLESLMAAAPEAGPIGHRRCNSRAIRVSRALALSFQPPCQLRRPELQQLHRRATDIADGRDKETAAGVDDAGEAEIVFPGLIVEAGGVVESRAASPVEQGGVDGAAA